MALSRGRSALLALLLAGAPSAARADDAERLPSPSDNAYAAAERRAILADADPGEAAAFLAGDQGERARQVADPGLYAALFERATELAYLRRLLFDGSSAERIRAALAADAGCSLCRKPRRLRRWASVHFSLDEKTRLELDRALLEWDAMPASFQAWAQARGYAPSSWEPLEWDDRGRLAGEWAEGVLARLGTRPPATRSELASAWADALTAGLVLGKERLRPVYKTLRAAQGTLTAPAAAFDGDTRRPAEPAVPGVSKPGMPVLGATRPFDAESRRMTADLLKPALLDEVGGTQAGEVLRAFYRDHPLRLRVASLDGDYARYEDDTGAITLDEDRLLEFLAERNLAPRDLAMDGRLLRQLALEWSANFVHEATHQRQQAWAAEHGVPFRFGAFTEQEAIQEEALYTLERRTRDRAYAAYLAAHREKSSVAREDARLADVLEKRGAAELRRQALNGYDSEPSLEQRASRALASSKRRRREIESELQRRAALGEAQRAAIERRPLAPLQAYSNAAFRRALPSLSASVLESWRAGYRVEGEGEPLVYEAYRKRIDDVDVDAQRRLQAVFSGEAASRGEPPPAAP